MTGKGALGKPRSRISVAARGVFLSVVAATTLTACGAVPEQVAVLRGNYEFSQGKYQGATVQYLDALRADDYTEVVAYNLGNVYHALGESEAAFRMWDQASEDATPDILFLVSFNRGILLYELGRYREAAEAFRYALTIDSAHVDAKKNLELSLRKIESGSPEAVTGGQVEDVRPAASDDQTADRVLEFVRRRGVEQWIANRTETDPSGDVQDW